MKKQVKAEVEAKKKDHLISAFLYLYLYLFLFFAPLR